MAQTGIYTELVDTALGGTAQDNSVSMLFAPGAKGTAPGPGGVTLEVGTSYMLTGLEDAVNLGINEEYDTTNKTPLYFNIKEFYDKADAGTKLWIYVYDKTTYAQTSKFLQAPDFLTAVRSTMETLENNRPRIIMVAQAEGQDTPTEGGLSEDTITCCTDFESALETLFGEGIRAVGILDAAVVSGISDLPDVSKYNAPRVALQIVTSTKTRNASAGRSGGIVSARNLATSIGNVSMGSVTTADYLVDSASNTPVNTPVTLLTRTQTNDLGAKQYLFTLRRNDVGICYNDGATMNSAANALSSIDFVRVANAVCDDCDTFFTKLLNVNIPVQSNGTINAAFKSGTLANLRSLYIDPYINRGDASQINVDFEAKDGNFVQSRALEVTVEILPNAPMREAFITVMFVSSL